MQPSTSDRVVSLPRALDRPLPRRWPWLIGLFRWYARRYLRKHLHAVRLLKLGRPPALEGPLVVVLNHPSWWDPLVAIALTDLFPGRVHYAPIEAKALRKYQFFERLGFFGIDTDSPRGGLTFVRTCEAVLARPDSVVWVTAQGRFTDPRQRPPRLMPGVAHLACRLSHATILPLALEYPFWEERSAEALACFGSPIVVGHEERSVDEWAVVIEEAMASTQDVLAAAAVRRDPAAFDVLLSGRAGVGGVYDVWRRFKAWLRGERFRAEHGDESEGGAA